jgi:flagellar assembly protein FliH
LSKNLYRTRFDIINDSGTRVIDNNGRTDEIVEEANAEAERRKMEEASAEAAQDGFTDGIEAENIEEQTETDGDGNVIKAVKLPDMDKVRAEADRIIADANSQAADIIARAQQDAESSRQSVYDEAQSQGYEDGSRQARDEEEQIKEQLEQQRKNLEDQYQDMIDEAEPQLVDTITEIYEHIFHTDMSMYHDMLMQLIASAMRNSEGCRSFMIHVSSDDYPAVSMEKKELQAIAGSAEDQLDVIEDISLAKGQCLIENENGILDCGIDTELTELRRKLKILSFKKS